MKMAGIAQTCLSVRVEEHELNLRQYRIVGGVYFIELFNQPPQPVTTVLRGIRFTTSKLYFPLMAKEALVPQKHLDFFTFLHILVFFLLKNKRYY